MEKQIIYILTKVGQGAISYNIDKDIIMTKYNEETDNGRFAGHNVYKVETTDCHSKMDYVSG